MPLNQALIPLWPVLQQAVARVRSQYDVRVEEAISDALRERFVRADRARLQAALTSLGVMACQALGGQHGRLDVQAEEIMFDDVVLDANAEKLQGGLPPRSHVRVHIGSSVHVEDDASLSARPAPAPAEVQRMALGEVRDFIESCHGSLTARSGFGTGTSFEIFLPSLPAPVGTAVGESAAEGTVPVVTGARHVLFVDDYPAMCALAQESLTDLGFRVTCYQDALEALAAVKAQPKGFDIAVVDFNMPRRSGTELARQIGRINPELPVVIISGYVDPGLQGRAFEAGAKALVDKSHNLDELGETVRRLLHLSS